ncbi:MAG: CHRD domain-containing protein [Alphaproteobacteria bacterium]|nr:CHRD domain-containing protein [Alphaproteobacteria bacterium]
MRTSIAIAALIAGIATIPAAHAATETFKGTLSAAAEVPPTQSSGTGSASVTLDTSTKQVTWRVEYSGLTGPAMAAHIHCGAAAGANAGVAVPLGPASGVASPITGSATMTDAQIADLTSGKCYVNVHTDKNKGGEVRAQLMK